MSKHKSPYTYPHRSRQAKVDYICGIGGYSDRYERWPIEFNVAADRCDLDFDNMLRIVLDNHHNPMNSMSPAELRDVEARVWQEAVHNVYEENKDHLWDWGVEDAVHGLFDSDSYNMLWDGTMLKVKFELRGRGGKHLVLTDFEGMDLRGTTPEQLSGLLMQKDDGEWYYSNKFVDTFYKYCRQCERDFTPKNASAEVEYQAAFQLYVRAEDEAKRLDGLLRDRDEVAAAAKTVYDSIPTEEGEEAWRTLCLAANLSPSAILQG